MEKLIKKVEVCDYEGNPIYTWEALHLDSDPALGILKSKHNEVIQAVQIEKTRKGIHFEMRILMEPIKIFASNKRIKIFYDLED